jgi:1-acyl-sn-glycerol-3-phosphate acyltransferase
MGGRSFSTWTGQIRDFGATVILWTYYTLGYLVLMSPFYAWSFFFAPRRDEAFQKLNRVHYRIFFSLLRRLVPGVGWRISKEVSDLRSSFIIANHLSFLDPILLISLFDRQKTIVRSDFFRVPLFGWMLKTSGYVPSSAEHLFAQETLDRIKSISGFLSEGGNFFIFPEGTRSRSGRIGPFSKGAFRIARLCRAPLHIVGIRNTHRLFPPDRVLFNTREAFDIEVFLAGRIDPDYQSDNFSLSGLIAQAHSVMESKVS